MKLKTFNLQLDEYGELDSSAMDTELQEGYRGLLRDEVRGTTQQRFRKAERYVPPFT